MAPRTHSPKSRPALGADGRALFGIVVFLVSFGLVMVYSATSTNAVIADTDQFQIVGRQATYAVLGFAALWFFTQVKPFAYEKLARPMLITAIGLLVLVHIAPPTIAPLIGGAHRWLVFGSFQLQPSEVAKLALILWIATMVARDPKILRSDKGLMPFALVTALIAALVVTEPDLGTAAIIVAIAFAMVFVGGAPTKLLATGVGLGIGLAALMIAISPYQQRRIASFLNPWDDQYGQSYQNAQAQIGLGTGGLTGRGLGNSLQKAGYLPEAHTDMIGAVIAEELGLLGIGAIMIAFAALGIIGFRIARTAPSTHQRMLAVGVTTMLCLQGGINLAQVIGAFPITGVPLPFVSYGGTNLLISLAGIGILINISKQGANARRRGTRPATAERGDRGGRDGRPRQTGPRDRRRIAS